MSVGQVGSVGGAENVPNSNSLPQVGKLGIHTVFKLTVEKLSNMNIPWIACAAVAATVALVCLAGLAIKSVVGTISSNQKVKAREEKQNALENMENDIREYISSLGESIGDLNKSLDNLKNFNNNTKAINAFNIFPIELNIIEEYQRRINNFEAEKNSIKDKLVDTGTGELGSIIVEYDKDLDPSGFFKLESDSIYKEFDNLDKEFNTLKTQLSELKSDIKNQQKLEEIKKQKEASSLKFYQQLRSEPNNNEKIDETKSEWMIKKANLVSFSTNKRLLKVDGLTLDQTKEHLTELESELNSLNISTPSLEAEFVYISNLNNLERLIRERDDIKTNISTLEKKIQGDGGHILIWMTKWEKDPTLAKHINEAKQKIQAKEIEINEAIKKLEGSIDETALSRIKETKK